MARRSNMVHDFARVPHADIQRSSFDRSHTHKTTFDAGYLVPIFADEALPGDTFSLNMTGFCRLSTPLHPFMDNLFMNTFFFAVPIRLIWNNWVKMNGQQDNPGDSTDFLVPQLATSPAGGWLNGSLHDHFGLPVGVQGINVSALWHRAYNLIYNEWFRDENLIPQLPVPKDDGPDPITNYNMVRRGKRYDYFTSSLPWPQKGTSVTVPIGTVAPVVPTSTNAVPSFKTAGGNQFNLQTRAADTVITYQPNASVASTVLWTNQPGGTGLQADLTNATAATINQLRQAFQLQHLYERDARGGTRYTEIVRSHFGVVSPDARLQRPEYLGGGQSPVNLHTVPQTSPTGVTGSTTPQGNLAAYGTGVISRHGFSKGFTEHCVLVGLLSVRADLTYQQGLNRMWTRRGRFDFYWPALSHIGEQAVLSSEIYCDGTAGDASVFGYQERYAEYRYKPSLITGQMRSTFAQPLDTWHLSQRFSTRPLLNQAFIEENPPIARVVAVPTEPNFIGDFFFSMRCARPMPVYGVPGLIDHF